MSIEPDTEPLWVAQNGNNSSTNLTQPEPTQPAARQQQQSRQQPEPTSNASIFSFAYYSELFDVDTNQVLGRCLLALNPFSQARFFGGGSSDSSGIIGTAGEAKPDLYGPFWISTTVIFALFFSSSLTGVFYSMYKGVNYEYKFEVLSGAAMILYSYTFLWPVLLFLIIRQVLAQRVVSLVKLCCIFGYSNVIWIPVAILAVSPLAGAFPHMADLVRWLVVGFGYIFSALFLFKTLKPILVSDDDDEPAAADPEAKKQGYFLLGLIALLHVALTISIKYLFFGSLKELSK